jgi:hypothetical protein
MSKLNIQPRVAVQDPSLQRELIEHARQINNLSEGRGAARYNAAASAPTTGLYSQNDTVQNSNMIELGSPGSKYVIKEFICIAGGTPGTWVQARVLTGG